MKTIDIYAHCAFVESEDFENTQFETEVNCIEIGYPKTEIVDIEPVYDLEGLISEFKKYFEEWEYDESYHSSQCVEDYWIEGIVLKNSCAEFRIAA